MGRWLLLIGGIVLAGMVRVSVAEDAKPFALEYCPTTPTPTTASGQIPGALTAKYFPRLTEDLKLYIGTGLAYSLPAPKEEHRVSETGLKTGVAGQAGIDYKLSDRASINLDYKYLRLTQDPVRGAAEESHSPHLFGVRLKCDF
jgi:outer membrane protein W